MNADQEEVQKMRSITLFRCCDELTPAFTLERRRRLATGIVIAWLTSVVAMVEGLASLMTFGSSTTLFIEISIATCGALVLAIPAMFSIFIADQLESECLRRNCLWVGFERIGERLPRYVRRLVTMGVIASVAASVLP